MQNFPPNWSHCIFACLKSTLFAGLTWRSIWISVLKTFSASEVSANLIKPSEIWGTRNHTEIVVWNTLDSNHLANISLIHHIFPQADFNQGAIALWLSRLVVFDDLNLGTQMKNLFQAICQYQNSSRKSRVTHWGFPHIFQTSLGYHLLQLQRLTLGRLGRGYVTVYLGMGILFVFYMTYMRPPSKKKRITLI